MDYLVSVQGVGDRGSYQSKHAGTRDQSTLPAGSGRELTIRLDAEHLGRMTHAGSVYVSFDACPMDGGACISGTSAPLFFHTETGRTLIYGERVLCEQFGCGDLARRAEPQEPGTLRVLGGQPVIGELRTDEEGTASEGASHREPLMGAAAVGRTWRVRPRRWDGRPT